MKPTCRMLCFAAALAVWSGTVSAQERIELFTNVDNQPRLVSVDATVRGFGEVLAITSLTHVPTAGIGRAVAVAGGRYLAWVEQSVNHEGPDLYLFDRRTRTVSVRNDVFPPSFAVGRSSATIVAADSRRQRVFVGGVGFTSRGPVTYGLWAIDLGGRPPVQLSTKNVSGAYAADVDEFFIVEPFADNSGDTRITVVNASTGQELRRWTRPGYVPFAITEPQGRVLWIDDSGLVALDGQTGAEISRSNQFRPFGATLDAERGALVVIQGDFLVAVDPVRLTELGRTRFAFRPDQNFISSWSTPLPGRWLTGAYVVRQENRNSTATCNAIEIDALDSHGAKRATVDILARLGPGGSSFCSAHGVLVRSPFAPTSLAAAVSGRTVSLTWRDPGDTTSVEVEYGLAPGQRLGALRVEPAGRTDIAGVPPGTYYVRVRALNEVGASPASNEVRVVVP